MSLKYEPASELLQVLETDRHRDAPIEQRLRDAISAVEDPLPHTNHLPTPP